MGWAARPMLPRISQLSSSVPITFIYGGRSWVDMSSGLRVRANRPQSYVDVMVIEGGGHHAYAQYADEFNDYVNAVARLVDQGYGFRPGSEDLVQVEQPKSSIYRPRVGSSRTADESPEDSQDSFPSAQPQLHHRPKRRSLAPTSQPHQVAGDKDLSSLPSAEGCAPQRRHRSCALPPRPPVGVTDGETSG
ncbi:Alpha/beta hydrolase domain-containing protein 4 [Sparganum proliferum]